MNQKKKDKIPVGGNSNKNHYMVFNTTFNNISVISWRSVLSVEETGILRENHRPSAVTDKLYHINLHRVHLARHDRIELAKLVVIGTGCIGIVSQYGKTTQENNKIKKN